MDHEPATFERLHLQLSERDAKIMSMSQEILRLNEKIRLMSQGIEEALIMTDSFPDWFLAFREGRADQSQKIRDLARLGEYLRRSKRG
jgi:hypothetical protein